uniref:Ig-like domain-containing protein n=1 Tax=Neogobius melanostomus TaxID=47308 RepID=A0A8C6SK44_9GOBI
TVHVHLLLHSFSVALPDEMEVWRGSCLTIPCSFTVQDQYRDNLKGQCAAVWETTDYYPKTVAFTRATNGNLTQNNCTTTVHDITEQQAGKVFVRVQCDNALKWTFKDKSLNIKVKEAPPAPALAPPTLSVTEGQSVSLQCSTRVPCPSVPPALTWSSVLGPIEETLQQQQDGTFVKVSTLNFTAAPSHHDRDISCSAAYNRGSDSVPQVSAPLRPSVKCRPTNTRVTVSPSGPVAEHTDVTLTCSSEANPAVELYGWYKDDGGAHAFIVNSSFIYCEALNDVGTDRSAVTQLLINCRFRAKCSSSNLFISFVEDRPRNTRVTVQPQTSVREHSHVSLTCSSDASPAVQHYRWYKDDGGALTVIGNSAVLTMNASKDTTAVFCEAQNDLGTDNSTFIQLDVQCMCLYFLVIVQKQCQFKSDLMLLNDI